MTEPDIERLRGTLAEAFARREALGPESGGEIRATVDTALEMLDSGRARVAEPDGQGGWRVNEWLKQAVLISFRLTPMVASEGPLVDPRAGPACWYDKVPSKFAGWQARDFEAAGFRAVPGCFVRHSAHIAPGCVLMPCFVNLGAHVGAGTMIDTWATVGSCAQIGANCHISGGVGIGGVLEPVQARPVIVEENVFIGARSEIAEGVVVRANAVLAMGVYLGASTKIVDRQTGAIHRGEVPEGAVVVPGTLPGPDLPDGSPGPGLYCAVIVKRVDARTRARTAVNELLRG